MSLFLKGSDVGQLLPMPLAIKAVELTYRVLLGRTLARERELGGTLPYGG